MRAFGAIWYYQGIRFCEFETKYVLFCEHQHTLVETIHVHT